MEQQNQQNQEKMELIEEALHQHVTGALSAIEVCGVSCSVFGKDICNVNLCRVR